MAKKTKDPKDIAAALVTVEDWLEEIDRLKRQPEFAHSEFFSLLVSIIDDARNGRRQQEQFERCKQAAELAQSLFEETGLPQFAEWGIGLADYARTWMDDGDPVLFVNPLLQAEIRHLKEQAAENDPIKRFTAALLDANEKIQKSAISDVESMKQAADAVKEMEKPIEQMRKYIAYFEGTEQGERLKELLAETEKNLQRIAAEAAQMVQGNIDIVLSYLDEEIKKPKYKGMTLKEIMEQSRGEDGEYLEGSLFMQACAAASKAMEQDGKNSPDLPTYFPATAATYYALNNKASNQYLALQDIFLNLQPDGQFAWKPLPDSMEDMPQIQVRKEIVTKKSGKIIANEVLSSVALTYTGDLDGKLAKINKYDQSVLNAVCSLWMAGNKYMTSDDIYYFLTRKNRRTTRPTDKQKRRIELTLTKYSGMRIKMDVSSEIEEGLLISDGDRIVPIIDDVLLSYRIYSLMNETSGKMVSVYELKEAPFLLHYSLSMKNPQLVSYPAEWLDLKGISTGTEDVIVLRDYLLKEIKQLQGGFRDNPVINYDTLLSLLDLKEKDLTKKSKGDFTKKVSRILDAIKEKGIIKGYYQRTGQKGKVIGFEIEI